MLLRLRAGSGLASPRLGGSGPRTLPWRKLCAFALLGVAAACSNGGGDQVTAPQSVGMTSSTPPYYMDGQTTLYQAEIEVPLPVRQPTQGEKSGAAPKGTPYPHAPFLTVDDESVEIHYVLSNLDATPHNVWLLVDPWNEFVRWKPGVTVVSDEQTLPNEGYDQQFVLAPKSRLEGTITSDDTKEIAIKLASVEKFLASPQAQAATSSTSDNSLDPTQVCNNIFDYQNRSNSVPPDPFFTPWIPPVIAGLTGFDLGIRMQADQDSAAGAGNVAVEITMDVQDLNGNRMLPQDSTAAKIGLPPKTLSPPAARF